MAFRLEKEKTTSTPYVFIDEAARYMLIEGKCFHENIAVFFKEIIEWLEVYLKTEFESFTFENKIDYFNSSTTKLLYNLLLMMDEYSTPENKITVNWITSPKNDIMIECGEDFKSDCDNIDFNIIETEQAD